MINIAKYLRETRAEMRKVTWPNRKYVATATSAILVLVVIFGVFIMGIDWIFSKSMTFLMRTF